MKLLTAVLVLMGVLSAMAANEDLDQLIDSVFNPPGGTENNNSEPSGEEEPQGGSNPSEEEGFQGGSKPSEEEGFQGGSEPNPGGQEAGACQCVPYYLCRNSTIVTDGVGIIDIRIRDGPCENYLDVCCQAPDTVTEPITPRPYTRLGCGQRNADGIGFRITGDSNNEAQYGEFPWMVAILREEAVDDTGMKYNVYQCGGSLIHTQVVMTAAHCVAGKSPSALKVRAGEWDTQTKDELYPHQDRDVAQIVMHKDYYAGALYNDVALLFLSQPVTVAENVDVVCLPQQDEVFDHSRCFASGWGKDVFGKEGRYQVILKKVELPIVPRDECLKSLRMTRLGQYFELNPSFICAGGEPGKDTCKGDGGSPLVCPVPNNPSQYLQAGIVAWGIGCGENQTPGVYANIAMFRKWIDDKMDANNLDTTAYQYTS